MVRPIRKSIYCGCQRLYWREGRMGRMGMYVAHCEPGEG